MVSTALATCGVMWYNDVRHKDAILYFYSAYLLNKIQAEHNLRKISKSSYWRYEQARLNFWYQCDSNFQTAEVDAELASEFFEVRIVILLYPTNEVSSYSSCIVLIHIMHACHSS